MRFSVLLTTLSALPALAAQVVVSDVTYVRAAPVGPVERARPVDSLTRLELLTAPSVSSPHLDGLALLPAGVTGPGLPLFDAPAPSVSAGLAGPCGMAIAFLMRARRQAT